MNVIVQLKISFITYKIRKWAVFVHFVKSLTRLSQHKCNKQKRNDCFVRINVWLDLCQVSLSVPVLVCQCSVLILVCGLLL